MSVHALTKVLGNKKLANIYMSMSSPLSINELFDRKEKIEGRAYSAATKKSYISALHVKGYVKDNGRFTNLFHEVIQSEEERTHTSRAIIDKYKDDAELRSSVTIEDDLEIKDVFKILGKNVNMKFIYPPSKDTHEVNFDQTKVQYVRLNNLSHYIRYPEYVKFVSICPSCATEYETYANKSIRCEKCRGGITTRTDYSMSLSRSCFIYMIDYNHEQYVARSLSILPLGDFKAAIIVVKDKKAYTLFIIATAKPDKPKITLSFNMNNDVLPQIAKYIDNVCLRGINKQIYGMTYYKYAIILSDLASLARMVNYNLYIAGAGGVGKTATARLYTAVMTEKTKCQDSTNLSSGGGIRGSTQLIKIDEKVYTVHEPGILERYNIVTLDEILDMGGGNSDKSFLKSSLSSPTLSVEVAGNRTEIPKNATVIGTSNIPRWVKVRKAKYIQDGKNPEVEFEIEGRWHVDGQNIHFLDRFALLFYLDVSEVEPDFNISDQQISDIELRQMLYTPEIDNYLKVCSKIKVNLSEGIKKQLKMMSSLAYDPIHSTSRRNAYMSMTVQLHAMINQRSEANMSDVRFCKQMLRKCFNPITVNMLAETYEDVQHPLDIWALKSALAQLKVASKEQLKRQLSKRYIVSNFADVFEHALHYSEIIMLDKDKYRCAGIFD